MTKEAQRWIGAAFGFAAAVVWTTSGAQAALLCVVGASLCAAVPALREQKIAVRATTIVSRLQKTLEKRPAQPLRPKARRRVDVRPAAKTPPAAAPSVAAAAPAAPAAAPAGKTQFYDRDESSEHVYEVANYGW